MIAPQAPSAQQLLGLDAGHVEPLPAGWGRGELQLHAAAIEAFGRLREDAATAGFDLCAVSAFRPFDRQLAIWNAKARGERTVLDANEIPLDIGMLTPHERVFAILRWSALPGTSRHHWGSDLDVVDAAAIGPDNRIALEVAETVGEGPFAALHRWLDERIAGGRAHGFFRPYCGSGCAVAREPWHLSHAPLAAACQARFDPRALCVALAEVTLELREAVGECLEQILQRYVWVPAESYPPAWRALLPAAGWAMREGPA